MQSETTDDVQFAKMVDSIMAHLLSRFGHRPYVSREELKEVFGDTMTKRLDYHGWLRRLDNMPSKQTLFWLDSVGSVYERLRRGEILERLPSETSG